MEPRQCSTSVLEALMGFDEQQSEHRAPRHSRVLSEDYLQRVASIGVQKKKSPSRCHPFRMTIEEPPEVFNSVKVEDNFSCCNALWDREKADSALSVANMPLTIRNFMNEKHFSTDEVIQTSKGFQDLPEVVDSMDISPRPTRKKNNMFNHVKNRPSASKSHYTLTEENNDAGSKFKDRKQEARSSEDLDLLKSSRPFSEWRDKLCFSSSSSTPLKGSHLVNDNKCRDFHSSQNGKRTLEEKGRTMEYAMQPIKQPSQVSNILDGSRSKARHGFYNLHLKTSRPESTYDDVHRKETEYKRTSSPGFSNWKDEYKHSCFLSVESHKGRESREKVIEEQRKTRNLMLSKLGRKMNEMSILPHYATMASDSNCKPVKYDFQKRVCLNKEHLHSGSPLCLSCKDRRFDQLGKNSHRLRLDSASRVIVRSRIRSRYEALRNTWFLKPEGLGTWLQYKPLNTRSNKKDASKPYLKLSSKKLRIFPCPDSARDHVDNDGCMVGDDLRTRVEKKGLFDQHSVNSCTASKLFGVKTGDMKVRTVDNQVPDSLSSTLPETDGDSSISSCRATCTSTQQDGLSFERYGSKEVDYNVSLEEVYQPSPVSVLEPLFNEETFSSSESSGFNDLMKQLELLTWDSPGTNSEGHELFVSSDEDGGERSICNSDDIYDIMSTFKFKDSRDFSYLVDVLSEAGLHCRNLEKVRVLLHSQERHVVSPSVFEALEKKFGEQISWRRSERKLLFDRINSGLAELFQSFIGVPDWAKPVSRRFRPLLDQEMIEEELWLLLDSQEKEVNKALVDKQFGKEIGWIDLGDEIGSICRELERLLIIELVVEFGSSE